MTLARRLVARLVPEGGDTCSRASAGFSRPSVVIVHRLALRPRCRRPGQRPLSFHGRESGHQRTFQEGGHPEVLRTPGYPLFLAACGSDWTLGMARLRLCRCSSTFCLSTSPIDWPPGSLIRRLRCWRRRFRPSAFRRCWPAYESCPTLILAHYHSDSRDVGVHLREGKWWLPMPPRFSLGATYVRPVGFISCLS